MQRLSHRLSKLEERDNSHEEVRARFEKIESEFCFFVIEHIHIIRLGSSWAVDYAYQVPIFLCGLL